jgi:hypothetical protein
MLGMASNRRTVTPALDNTSAAINPAGPAPTIATVFIVIYPAFKKLNGSPPSFALGAGEQTLIRATLGSLCHGELFWFLSQFRKSYSSQSISL